MKTNCWLVLGTMLATSAVAQVNTNTLPEIPAAGHRRAGAGGRAAPETTAAPAKKAGHQAKKAVKKKPPQRSTSPSRAEKNCSRADRHACARPGHGGASTI